MKIAALTTYFDPEENGLTRYINGLYGALLKEHPEIEVDVITFDTLKTKKYKEKTNNRTIYRLDCIPMLGRTYAVLTKKGKKQLREIFQNNSYDLINTHTRFFLSSYYGIRLSKKYHIPVIHTEHGSGFVKHSRRPIEWAAKAYDLTLGKYVLKNADLVCGVSESCCQFAKKLGAKKTAVVSNGINLEFWKSESVPSLEKKGGGGSLLKRDLGINNNDIVFTFIGRLIPEKGVQNLIEVLYGLPFRPLSRNPKKNQKILSRSRIKCGMTIEQWELLIIGDGFYRRELEKLVKKYKLEDKILFWGAKNQKEVRNILRITDLFINPSLASEGLPTTILEAAACGCRVLSSDKGGSVEVLNKENLYRAGNLTELKKKILRYRKIPVPKAEKFDWQEIADEYYRLILKIK